MQPHREIKRLETQLQSVTPEADCKAEYGRLNKRLYELKSQIADIGSRLAAIRQELLTKCRVLATTVYQTYLKPELERLFDIVIIDEASMLALPMVYISAGRATESVIVAGDFRQLPPIVVSEDDQWHNG